LIRRLLATALILAAALGGACTRAVTEKDRLLAAIDSTEKLARTFDYQETAAGHRVDVRGVVHDDFRYSEDATLDGQPLAQQVVYDDARAFRIEDPQQLAAFLSVSHAGYSSQDASAAIASLPAALKQGRWVVDPKGVVGLSQPSSIPDPGVDPLVDALASLEYARRSINQASDVQLYNPQSENYRPALDPFPRPPSGVLRYDLVPPDLPPRQVAGGAGANAAVQNQVPGVPFFRLMAFYVKDGVVQQVRESISIDRRLNDSQSNLQVRISDFAKIPGGASEHLESILLLRSLNAQLAQTNQSLIRPRDMVFTLGNLGRPQPVELPAGAATGSLSVLGEADQPLYETS
jgi:hypothetical protein